MGSNLRDLIQSTNLPLTHLKGCKVAVDGNNMLFQILYNPYQNQAQKTLGESFYMDRTQRVINHLYAWLSKMIYFFKYGMTPVMVFDGKPDPFKREISKNYGHDFTAIKEKYETAIKAGDLRQAKNFALSKSFMWLNCVYESQRLLEACGVAVVHAPSEAEAQCAHLQKSGLVDYVVSNDYDAVLFGGSKILRQITFISRTKKDEKWINFTPEIKMIDVPTNLTRLGLSYFQLIDLSIILGNDYFPGIPNIGPKKALASIQLFKTLEQIRIKHPQLLSALSEQKITDIRKLFCCHDVIDLQQIQSPGLNLGTIQQMLLKDHTLNPEKVQNLLTRLEKAYTRHFGKSSKFTKITEIPLNTAQDGFVPANLVTNTSNRYEKELYLKKRTTRKMLDLSEL